MGDVGATFRAWKEHKKERKRKLGRACIGCITHFPRRSPTILFPGQQCRVCGYTDNRISEQK